MFNNSWLTWDKLKRSLEEYYRVVSNPNVHIVELALVKQGRTEGLQDYMQRVAYLAESAYIGVDGGSQVIRKQMLGFFIEGIRDQDIKIVVIKGEPLTLEAAYQKTLSELKCKIRLNASMEYDDNPMEVCHSRR